MHLPINVKSPNNIRKWHMGFNSAFKGLMRILLLTKYYSDDQIGRMKSTVCITLGEGRDVNRVLVGKPVNKRPLGRTRCRWEDSI
jgi:hypothetical protein